MPSTSPLTQYMVTTVLSTNDASVSFTIPAGIKNIELYWTFRGDISGVARDLYLRVNSNTSSANYRTQYITSNNTSTTATALTSQSRGATIVGIYPGSTAASGLFGTGKISIAGWNAPHSSNLGIVFQSGIASSSSANSYVRSGGSLFVPSSPYTSLSLIPQTSGENFVTGSQVTLIGRY